MRPKRSRAAGAGADAPAGRCRAGLHGGGRPQQHERNFCFAGCEMQPLAQLEVEPCRERAGDRRRHARVQGFLHGPQRLLVVAGLDQDQASRIETEAGEAVTVRAAEAIERARRADEQQRSALRHAADERREETEGSGHVAFGLRARPRAGPAGRPPCGRCASSAGRPKGRARVPGRTPSIRGSRRRSSSRTSARFRYGMTRY